MKLIYMKLIYFIASGFGSGYLPKIPGTFGSLVGLVLTSCLLMLGNGALIIAFFIATILGWYCSKIIMAQGDQVDPDPSFIVIDEIAGMMLTVLLIFFGIHLFSGVDDNFRGEFSWSNPWQMVAMINAFWAFRLFDILKPTPIHQIDHKMGISGDPTLQAIGIMLDDLVAAVYAAIIVVPIVIYSA